MLSNARIVVLEKESVWAFHQTATIAALFTLAFTTSLGVSRPSFAVKVVAQWWEILSTARHWAWSVWQSDCCNREQELLLLENLYKRGLENGLSVTKLSAGGQGNWTSCTLSSRNWCPQGMSTINKSAKNMLTWSRSQGGELRLNVEKNILYWRFQVLETNNGTLKPVCNQLCRTS